MPIDIIQQRLSSQSLSEQPAKKIVDTVKHMVALQSQDYEAGKHSVGIRSRSTHKQVVDSINKAEIIRSWPMRGTIHIVAASDIRWMLELLGPKVLAGAPRRMEFLGIDKTYIDRCRKLTVKNLSGTQMTREEYYDMLRSNKVPLQTQVGYHVIWRMCQEGITCFAKEKSGKPTIALLDEWIKPTSPYKREKSLGEIVTRYFTSHGPATIADLMFWSGLGKREIQQGIEIAGTKLSAENINSETYYFSDKKKKVITTNIGANLLPAFDEYILGYKMREDFLEKKVSHHVATKNGIFRPTILIDGKIRGTWKKERKKNYEQITLLPFTKLTTKEKKQVDVAVDRYSKYLATELQIAYGEIE